MPTVLGVPDPPLLLQTLLYYVLLLLGFLVAVPVGATSNAFLGYCIMYATVSRDKIMFGSSGHCGYVTYFHVVLSIIYAGTMAALHTLALIRSFRRTEFRLVRSFLANLILLGVNALISALALVAACLLSVGFARFCSSLTTNAFLNHGYRMKSCSEAEHVRWEEVDGSRFHHSYSLATVGCWLALLVWLVQTALNVLHFLRLRREGATGYHQGAQPCSMVENHVAIEPGGNQWVNNTLWVEKY